MHKNQWYIYRWQYFFLYIFIFFKGRPERAPMVTAYEWVPILNFGIGAGLWWYTHFACGTNTWLWSSKVESKEINDSSPSETRTTDPLHYRPTLNQVSYSAPPWLIITKTYMYMYMLTKHCNFGLKQFMPHFTFQCFNVSLVSLYSNCRFQ